MGDETDDVSRAAGAQGGDRRVPVRLWAARIGGLVIAAILLSFSTPIRELLGFTDRRDGGADPRVAELLHLQEIHLRTTDRRVKAATEAEGVYLTRELDCDHCTCGGVTSQDSSLHETGCPYVCILRENGIR